MLTGEVFRYDSRKGFGFIRPDNGGADVLVHIKELAPHQDPTKLRPGASVAFEVVETSKGLRAVGTRFIPKERRTPAFSPPADDGECDVLSPDQFDAELRDLLLDSTEPLRVALVQMARRHGWVEP